MLYGWGVKYVWSKLQLLKYCQMRHSAILKQEYVLVHLDPGVRDMMNAMLSQKGIFGQGGGGNEKNMPKALNSRVPKITYLEDYSIKQVESADSKNLYTLYCIASAAPESFSIYSRDHYKHTLA